MTASLTLIAADGSRTPDPEPDQIAAAVRALTIDSWFVILERDEETFLQVAVKADFFALERRAGGDETQEGTSVDTIDQVVETFQAYAREDQAWASRFTWARVKL